MTNTLWLMSAIILWSFLHSVLASLKFKSFVKRKFGILIDRYYRLFYNLFAAISISPIMGMIMFFPGKQIYKITLPWMVVTLIIQIIAFIVIGLAAKQTSIMDFLGLKIMGEVEIPSQPILKTNGFYKFVRHPIYTAGLVLMWGVPVMTMNYLAFALLISSYILIGASFEERKLLIEFGDAYHNYQQRVPMLIPGLLWNKWEITASKKKVN